MIGDIACPICDALGVDEIHTLAQIEQIVARASTNLLRVNRQEQANHAEG